MFHAGRSALKFVAIAASIVALSAVSRETFAAPGNKRPSLLVVPTDYPTIQSAIDAVKPGGTVIVLAGTYREQVSLTRDVDLVGAGMDRTIIRAPATLVPGPMGSPAIVEVFDGATSLGEFLRTDFTHVSVDLAGGDDTFQIDTANGDPLPATGFD